MAKRGRKKHSVSVTLQPNTYYFLLGAVSGRKERLGDLINAIVDMVVSQTQPAELQAFAENLFRKPRRRKKTEEAGEAASETAETVKEPTEEGAEPVDDMPIIAPMKLDDDDKPIVVPMDSTMDSTHPKTE